MRKHVRISPASENLLRRFVGAVIADLLARKSRGKVNPETGRLEVADVGIVLDTGEKALVWVRAFDIVPKLEGLLLEITTDFAIPQWPGGPLTEWESISSKVLGFSQSRVTSIGILERFYDKETHRAYLEDGFEDTCVDEALVIGLQNSRTLVIGASLDVPTQLEVFSLSSENFREWSTDREIRILGTSDA